MYRLLKPLLFTLQPETAHHFVMRALKIPLLAKLVGRKDPPGLQRKVAGLDFRNPVGLAAGMDKDALAFEAFGDLGFGFVEVGTVTPRSQPGNPRPRLFRLPKNEALINRMGFNNHGADAMAARLKKRRDRSLIIGGNIGKNKDTPNERADDDYLQCLRVLHPYVDYFVVNVSSPNTPNLRELQGREPLTRLLKAVQAENSRLGVKPVFLKIAPDMNDFQIDEIAGIVRECGLAGIIATNTTVSREGLDYPAEEIESIGAGGLSGQPLRARSTEVIGKLRQQCGDDIAIIGVGGIHCAADALEKLDAGADLVQLYTGFVYHGPALISEIKNALLKRKK